MDSPTTPPDSAAAPLNAVSVSQFVQTAKQAIEEQLPPMWISGEVANFTAAASGHWYFVIRDPNAQLDCVMFSFRNKLVGTPLKSGDKIIAFGQPTLYTARGNFQLTVQLIQFDGVGQLHAIYLQRKKDYHQRGWFADSNKKTLPPYPQRIGVISSTAGAALQDVLKVIRQRYPVVSVIIYHAPAQGATAADKIAQAIHTANQENQCDVLILCRGGGGIEDLWAYNEEPVVAAVVDSTLPLITGIGHEIDETLADLAADHYAPTPTAAAVAAVPKLSDITHYLTACQQVLKKRLSDQLADHAQRLDWAAKAFANPTEIIKQKQTQLQGQQIKLNLQCQQIIYELTQTMREREKRIRQPDLSGFIAHLEKKQAILSPILHRLLDRHQAHLSQLQTTLRLLSPANVLVRGYSIACDEHGKIITNASQVRPQQNITVNFQQGQVAAKVVSVKKTNDYT